MRFPNFPAKYLEDSLLEPSHYLQYLKKRSKYPNHPPPRGVIFCYQRSLLAHIKENHPIERGDGFLTNLLFLSKTKNQIAVLGSFGIGAPVASVYLEELIAFGVQEFISIGTAGTLQKDIQIGDLIVCDRAIRDEGTSHHYLPTEKYAYPSSRLTHCLTQCLSSVGKPFRLGASWTTDAPYRETIVEAKQYQEEGVAAIDMEAAALFAVAQYRKVDLAAAFTVSDSLADFRWQLEFHHQKTQEGLETLYQAALSALFLKKQTLLSTEVI